MVVFIRADASTAIGTGHIVRCATLAEMLRECGAEICFISRDLPGDMCAWCESKGYTVYRLPWSNPAVAENRNYAKYDLIVADAKDSIKTMRTTQKLIDWVIVDHYQLDANWERMVKETVKRVMVIDDLADRMHDCDIILDQNLVRNFERRYDKLVPAECKKLLGPRFALLRKEFIHVRKQLKEKDGKIKRIFIFFGGSDPTGETIKALQALQMIGRTDLLVDVVVGAANPNQFRIKERCTTMSNVNFHLQIDNMAELMAGADLAIGAGGTNTWERCFLGVPTITVITADNQWETTTELAKRGAAWLVGKAACVSSGVLANRLRGILNNPSEVKDIGEKAMRLMDGAPFGPDNLDDLMRIQ